LFSTNNLSLELWKFIELWSKDKYKFWRERGNVRHLMNRLELFMQREIQTSAIKFQSDYRNKHRFDYLDERIRSSELKQIFE
jgi:hypothetical protein